MHDTVPKGRAEDLFQGAGTNQINDKTGQVSTVKSTVTDLIVDIERCHRRSG